MSDRRVSKEELEAFWRGDKNTYQRMYSQRMQQKADEAEKQGKQVTYIPNDGSATLPEVSITAPRETEEQKNLRLKQDYESFTNNAITAAGFVPGLDIFSDVADIGNSWRKDDYSGMLWGLAGLGLPVSGKALKSGWNWFKNLPSIRNYKAAREINVVMNNHLEALDKLQQQALKQGNTPTEILDYKKIGTPDHVTMNPFTGHYDNDKLITQEYPTVNIQDNLFNPKRWFEELGNRKYYEGDNAYTFNDITTLQKHLPEYYNHQFFNKYNDPNYMKSFPLDESAYLMLQSKAIKTNYNPELIYSGIEESINPNYNGILWGVRGQGLVPAYKARAYTTSDKGVMPILYDKNAKIVNTDMQGKSWYKLSYNGNTVRTNDIVDDLFNKGNDIVQMDNVLDPGPNLIPSNSKYQLFKDRLDQLTMGMFPQNNVILKPGVIRKSLLGNNGDFDKSNLNLYRKKGGKLQWLN